MLEVKIPKEITEYREKIAFGLSVRQIVCISLAVTVSIGAYYFMTSLLEISGDIASYVVMFIAVPIMGAGFIRKNGLTFERYVALYFRHMFGNKKRAYKSSPIGDEIANKGAKNARFYKKEESEAGSVTKKDNQKGKIRESETVKTGKKDRKRKRKEALREIKAARKEYRAAEQAYKKSQKGTDAGFVTKNNSL